MVRINWAQLSHLQGPLSGRSKAHWEMSHIGLKIRPILLCAWLYKFLVRGKKKVKKTELRVLEIECIRYEEAESVSYKGTTRWHQQIRHSTGAPKPALQPNNHGQPFVTLGLPLVHRGASLRRWWHPRVVEGARPWSIFERRDNL